MQVKSQGEHSAILSPFIKLSLVIKIFVFFEWQFYTGFAVFKLANPVFNQSMANKPVNSMNILLCLKDLYAYFFLNLDSKNLLSNHSKIDKTKANDKWFLNEVRKYCRMLPLEHSAILLSCI